MTAVLLIADTGRVQKVFADLESRGVLQLHAAATLSQVDQELAACTPEFTFVQSRISGLSTSILQRHLKKALPENSKIILLSADAADLPPKGPAAMPFVDLRVADDVLAEAVASILTGTAPPSPGKGGKRAERGEKEAKKEPRPKKGARSKEGTRQQGVAQTPQEDAAGERAKLKRPQVETKKQNAGGVPGQAPGSQAVRQGRPAADAEQALDLELGQSAQDPDTVVQPQDHVACHSRVEAESVSDFALIDADATHLEEASPEAPLVEPSLAEEQVVAEETGRRSFIELVDAASAKGEIDVPPNVEDQVCLGRGAEEVATAPPSTEFAPRRELPEAGPAVRGAETLPPKDQVDEAPPATMKRKKPLWAFLLLSVFLLVPSTAYLLGRLAKAPEQEVRQQNGTLAGERPALFAAPTSVTAQTRTRLATGKAADGTQKQEAPHLAGVAALPPFLEGLEFDRAYSATHPGWEHYLGAKAEYRVFREGGRYRAVQAIARGDEIPDLLFRRVLLEFGGIAGYGVSSTQQKGNYLVEQATGSGSASLTIYRTRNNQRIKGLVVYYH
jgi:hypothetical protein